MADRAWNPLVVAICSTTSLSLLIASGVSCSFVLVNALPGEILEILDTSAQKAQNATKFGMICEGDFYELQGDEMWMLSRVFLFTSLICGAITSFMAWAVSTCAVPTRGAWQAISLVSAFTAVVEVPVYLLFQSMPCSAFPEAQECAFGPASYTGMASVFGWMLVTVLTQCLDPPAWASNLDLWLIRGRANPVQKQPRSSKWCFGCCLRHGIADMPLLAAPSANNSSTGWMDETMLLADEEEAAAGSNGMQCRRRGSCFMFGPELSGQVRHVAMSSQSSSSGILAQDHDAKKDEDNLDALHKHVRVVVPSDLATQRIGPLSHVQFTPTSQKQVSNLPFSMHPFQMSASVAMANSPSQPTPPHTPTRPAPDTRVLTSAASWPSYSPSSSPSRHVRSPSLPSSPSSYRSEHDTRDLTAELEDLGSLTLGSLEPTVTGDESMLDATRAMSDVSADSIVHEPCQAQEEVKSPTVVETEGQDNIIGINTALCPAERRTEEDLKNLDPHPDRKFSKKAVPLRVLRGRIKGYRLMNDEDIESSFPISPPLEIVTVSLNPKPVDDGTVSPDAQIASGRPVPTDFEQKLIDDWIALHSRKSRLSLARNQVKDDMELLDWGDPEPDLNFSDDSDDNSSGLGEISWDSGSSYGRDGPHDHAQQHSRLKLPPRSPRRGVKTRTLKRKRRPKRRRHGSAGSVASSPSLLDYTIEEETAADLQSSDMDESEVIKAAMAEHTKAGSPFKRTNSAPNLARYAAQSSSDRANVYLEDVRIVGINSYHRAEIWRSVDSSGSPDSSGRIPPRNRAQLRRAISRSPSPTDELVEAEQRKAPMFRKERDKNATIHAPALVSSDSGSDGSERASSPSRASQARLARIQRMMNRQENRPQLRRARSLEDFPSLRYHSSSTERDSDDNLNTLDLHLAFVLRPHGVEYGPEEASL